MSSEQLPRDTEQSASPKIPMPGEISPHTHANLKRIGQVVGILFLGIALGIWVAPDTPQKARQQISDLQSQLADAKSRAAALEQAEKTAGSLAPGKMRPADKAHVQREAARYAAALRRVGAQGASDLMRWFAVRWIQLLDQPQDDDRTNRRAATLSLLIGGMAANVNPGDYVPWQSEFLSGHWLPELHYDWDNDGLPAPRSHANTHDGFANVSICQIAMALNQSMTDAQVLVMPELHCDRPDSRMSVFLQGATFDDALTEFVQAAKGQGFVIVERHDKHMRLVLIGARPQKPVDPLDSFGG